MLEAVIERDYEGASLEKFLQAHNERVRQRILVAPQENRNPPLSYELQ